MKWYRIYNRITRENRQAIANSAHEACKLIGWCIGDCWVRECRPGEIKASKTLDWLLYEKQHP